MDQRELGCLGDGAKDHVLEIVDAFRDDRNLAHRAEPEIVERDHALHALSGGRERERAARARARALAAPLVRDSDDARTGDRPAHRVDRSPAQESALPWTGSIEK